MGHYCRICGRERANEKFSGKGHRVHVCKDCWKLPPAQREKIDPGIRHLAGLVRRVAKISEGKRKRWAKIQSLDPALYRECLDEYLTDCPADFESGPDDSNRSFEIPF